MKCFQNNKMCMYQFQIVKDTKDNQQVRTLLYVFENSR